MPIKRKPNESKDKFISRCMSQEAGKFPDVKQRYAVCIGYFGDSLDELNAATNEANRAIVAEYHGLGPEKASEQPDANQQFWDTYAKAMMVDVATARTMLCANCEYFDNSPEALRKMDAVPMDQYDADGGGRGYCDKFDFICHNLRTCRAWEADEDESTSMSEISDAKPRTLYVSRKVLNGKEIASWAKSSGFTNILSPDDMHVTIAYSKKPIDWMRVPENYSIEITINEGGPRAVEEFNGGAKVLQFKSSELHWRHNDIKDAGASWDWPDYLPHITISYGDMPENVKPYSGKIVLGPEIFEEINDDWKSSAVLQDGNNRGNNSNMTKKFLDKATIGTVKRTSDGYITARAKAVRSGVQLYRGAELGLFDRDVVRVMRPETEVFAKDSVAGFVHAPITNNHPAELVDADNWSKYAVGEVGANVMRDGEFLALDLILKDASAIADFNSGKKELSAGYTAEIEFVDGADGYDAVMKNIRINHLALVDAARAGSEARIGDSAANQWGAAPLTIAKEVPKMDMKAVAIGDKAVNVAASDADTLKEIVDAKDAAIGELKAKLADAEAKILSDEQIQEKAKEIADAMSRREAVKAKFGDEAVKDASDAEIMGMFKVIDKAPAKDDTARKAMGDAMKMKAGEADDPWAVVNSKKKGAK